MEPNKCAMLPSLGNQVSPFFNQMNRLLNPQLNYPVNIHFSQFINVSVAPSFNPQQMRPFTTNPFTSSNPQMNQSFDPRMFSNSYPQYMPPMNQQMLPMSQQMPPMNQQMPPMNQQMPPMNQQMPPMSQQMPPMNQQMPPMNLSPFPNFNNCGMGVFPPNQQPVPPFNLPAVPPINMTGIPTNNGPPVPPVNTPPLSSMNPQAIFPSSQQPVPSMNYPSLPLINQPDLSLMNQPTLPLMNQPYPPSMNQPPLHFMNQPPLPPTNSPPPSYINQPPLPPTNSPPPSYINQPPLPPLPPLPPTNPPPPSYINQPPLPPTNSPPPSYINQPPLPPLPPTNPPPLPSTNPPLPSCTNEPPLPPTNPPLPSNTNQPPLPSTDPLPPSHINEPPLPATNPPSKDTQAGPSKSRSLPPRLNIAPRHIQAFKSHGVKNVGPRLVPLMNCQPFPSANSQNVRPQAGITPPFGSQTIPSCPQGKVEAKASTSQLSYGSKSSQTTNPQNNPQTVPAVNEQNIPSIKKPAPLMNKFNFTTPSAKSFQNRTSYAKGRRRRNTKLKPKVDVFGKRTLFWINPDCIPLKKNSRMLNTKNLDICLQPQPQPQPQAQDKTQTKKPKIPRLRRDRKKLKKILAASQSNEKTSSENSNVQHVPLININAKENGTVDESKTEYFKNLSSSVVKKDNAKKKRKQGDKCKTKVLKLFILMKKLRGAIKHLRQNVTPSGQLRDSPQLLGDIVHFNIISKKFMAEVNCLVKLTGNEEKPSKKKVAENKTKSKNLTQNGQEAKSMEKRPKSDKRTSLLRIIKALLKHVDVLDNLGLCFVNLSGVLIKKFCLALTKLRISLNKLIEEPQMRRNLKMPKQPHLSGSAAIKINCFGKISYEQALRMIMVSNRTFKKIGIERIDKRPGLTGGIIFEVFGQDCHEKADKLQLKLNNIFKNLPVRITRPQKFGELRISGLDSSITVEQVKAQLAKLVNCTEDIFSTGRMGKKYLWVRCPLKFAAELDRKTIIFGSIIAQIFLKAFKFVRCYKCFKTGHIKPQCQNFYDHDKACFRCGQGEHKAKTCKNRPRCLACQDKSLPSSHRLGGEKCFSTAPEFVSLELRKDTLVEHENAGKKDDKRERRRKKA